MPCLPTIRPPNDIATYQPMITDSAVDSDNIQLPDEIDSPQSDDSENSVILPDSDSNHSSEMDLLVSDREESAAMDVVQSDEQENTMPVASSESGEDSDVIVLPKSPSISRSDAVSGGVVQIQCDPHTGRYTAASFANFPDELFD